MTARIESRCVICREDRGGSDGWFLLTENQWTDRVKILSWNETLVSRRGVQAACCAAHVQQLVVHWMATGSLEYPFAQSRPPRRRPLRHRAVKHEGSVPEPDTSGSKVLGELAVHRESLERVLVENPESLAGILKALLSALGDSSHAEISQTEELYEEDDMYALTEV